MMSAPNPTRLSSLPYLMAAVLHCAIVNNRDPGALAQKAHRLINKHDYKHEKLDRTAQVAWGTDVFEYLDQHNPFNHTRYIIEVIITNTMPANMEKLDKKDASFGNLRDFINHCLSGDE